MNRPDARLGSGGVLVSSVHDRSDYTLSARRERRTQSYSGERIHEVSAPLYPVLDEEYAREIAERWNTKDEQSGYAGYVTRFQVRSSFLEQFPVKQVGDARHCELWIPAESVEDMNRNLVGKIEVIAEFSGIAANTRANV